MNRTITGKIVFSYILLIMVSFVMLAVVFSMAARKTIEAQAGASLKNDAKMIVEDITEIYGDSIGENNSSGIRQTIREKLMKAAELRESMKNIESEWTLVTENFRVLLAFSPEQKDWFEKNIADHLKKEYEENNVKRIKVIADKKEYIVVVYPVRKFTESINGNMNRIASLVLYTPVQPVRDYLKIIIRILFISLIIAGLIAVIFGVIFARSIAKPIIKLKKRSELLVKRDFDTRVDIKTGDELEDLAHTIDTLAVELKEHDITQKRFLQNASHELKTPLMSIQGYAEGVKDGVFEDNEEAMNIIVEESNRLEKLVDEIIFLTKLETADDFYSFSKESINTLIEKSVEKINSLAIKNKIRINTILYTDAILEADGNKLIQALINLLGNCMRYAREEINIVTGNDGKTFRVTIYDDGEGFARNEAEKVFERFYKGKKGNQGLGLAITRAIIEKHRGTITAGNREDGGAQFIIELPIKL